jgi:hypothetical protein
MVNQHERSKAPHRSAILMNDRRLVVSALVMLMMSGWSGAALAAIGDADVDGAKYGDSRADDATWGRFQMPSNPVMNCDKRLA